MDKNSLTTGEQIPDVQVTTHHGESEELRKLAGQSWCLVYFFPMSHTPGCTLQACNLRDAFEELTELNLKVIGVSADKPGMLRNFRKVWKLPFDLVSDPDKKLAEVFGVKSLLGMTARSSFLFQDGELVWSDLKAAPTRQAQDVIRVMKEAGESGD